MEAAFDAGQLDDIGALTPTSDVEHAATTVDADDQAGLERLCRYFNRPPLAYG